ncbi:PAS domain S-box protein [Neptunomonas concharum]|uniref:PAS domain S-box protein n=1 Tax=Neptunomonas concharum TaxID=1031538 RepID=A0A5P1R7H3_9GAMM|nr:PAS domain S-box protein [Neptunomonas concharum]QEQ95547.1 PAS domain S-box protein [Neptunomonas concharum]
MDSFAGLLNNAVLLLALGVVYDSLGFDQIERRLYRKLATGLIVGIIGIAVMLTPWELLPGVFFDTRWVLISLCALYFGFVPTLIAVLMTVALRLYQGGAGIYVGSWVIISSAIIGLLWRYWSRKTHTSMGWGWLWLMGLTVQINVLCSMYFMPEGMRMTIFMALVAPLLILFPLGTMLLGVMLQRQKERRRHDAELLDHKMMLDRERGLLKELLNGIPDLIFYKTKKGVYLGCNHAFETFVGLKEPEIVGKTDFDLFEQDVAAFFRDKDKQMLERQKATTNEEWVVYPDGQKVLLETLKTPFFGKSGTLYGLVGISRNITNRYEADARLRRSENIYRNVLSTALDGFWIASSDGVILDANKAYVEMSGYALYELQGMEIHQLDALESQKLSKEHIEQVIKERGQRFVSAHRRKDGSVFDVEINVSYWPEEGGRFFVFIKDITEQQLSEQRLLKSEARFRHIFENMPAIAVQGYNNKREVIFWNSASEQLYGYKSKEALGNKLEDLIIPESIRDNVIREVSHWVEGGSVPPASEMVLQRADGSPIPVFSSHIMVSGVQGEPEMYCIDMDLTSQKQAEQRIRTLSQALEQSPVSVILTDTEGTIVYVNGTFERVTGYTSEEVIGKTSRILKSGHTSPVKYQQLWASLTSGEAWEGEFQNSKKNGEIFWEYAHIAPVKNDQGAIEHYLAVKQDITEQKAQEEKILYQAHFDSLTRLPNRFLSLDRLTQMIKESRRSGQKVAVMFLDLDDFKKVNDSLGHEVGDALLEEAAIRLRSTVRDDDVVGRLGGDEFIVLLGQLDDDSVVGTVCAKLLDSFRAPFKVNNRELVSTVSIGVSIYPTDGELPAELLRQADAAMYHSKEQGRNTYNFYTARMNEDVAHRLLIEEQLRGALSRNELSVHYQPLVALDSRSLVGAEALLRWNNPVLGSISPEEFIPIAEKTGIIVSIGRFVLQKALQQNADWKRRYNTPLRIAVNLSPRQFRDDGLLPYIKQVLDETGLSPEHVELEITEGVLMSGHTLIDQALESLNKMGIGISMDDFGTGYSSLSYLRSYPFDTLKVDKSFIQDITVDPADLELVGAAVAMGQGLGLKVIAEGVETEAQYQLLATLGCDYGQGYLFGKPVDAEIFETTYLRH